MSRLYKNMEVFKLGYELVLDVYNMLDKLPKDEQDNIISQMKRSATSIPLNIAEGSVKKSDREFLSYLSHAYGSAKEFEVLLSLSKDLKYISDKEHDRLFVKLDKLMAKLFGFMENIESRFEKRGKFFTRFRMEK